MPRAQSQHHWWKMGQLYSAVSHTNAQKSTNHREYNECPQQKQNTMGGRWDSAQCIAAALLQQNSSTYTDKYLQTQKGPAALTRVVQSRRSPRVCWQSGWQRQHLGWQWLAAPPPPYQGSQSLQSAELATTQALQSILHLDPKVQIMSECTQVPMQGVGGRGT